MINALQKQPEADCEYMEEMRLAVLHLSQRVTAQDGHHGLWRKWHELNSKRFNEIGGSADAGVNHAKNFVADKVVIVESYLQEAKIVERIKHVKDLLAEAKTVERIKHIEDLLEGQNFLLNK